MKYQDRFDEEDIEEMLANCRAERIHRTGTLSSYSNIGAVEDLPKVKDFESIATVEGPESVGTLMVGADLRLYRQTRGLLEAVVPCEPLDDDEEKMWIKKVQVGKFAPMRELVYLFDTFLSKYNREVMFLVGARYDGEGFFYMIPRQEGTPLSVEWDDALGRDWFSQRARLLGTVHIHPGNSASPSTTDLDTWSDKDHSGVHVIFGRDGSWTMHASIAGHCVSVKEGSISKRSKRTPVELHNSLGRKKRKKLLRKPKVRIVSIKRFSPAKRIVPSTSIVDSKFDKVIDRIVNDRIIDPPITGFKTLETLPEILLSNIKLSTQNEKVCVPFPQTLICPVCVFVRVIARP